MSKLKEEVNVNEEKEPKKDLGENKNDTNEKDGIIKEEEKSLEQSVNDIKDKEFLANQIVSNNKKMESIENALSKILSKLEISGDDGFTDSETKSTNEDNKYFLKLGDK